MFFSDWFTNSTRITSCVGLEFETNVSFFLFFFVVVPSTFPPVLPISFLSWALLFHFFLQQSAPSSPSNSSSSSDSSSDSDFEPGQKQGQGTVLSSSFHWRDHFGGFGLSEVLSCTSCMETSLCVYIAENILPEKYLLGKSGFFKFLTLIIVLCV